MEWKMIEQRNTRYGKAILWATKDSKGKNRYDVSKGVKPPYYPCPPSPEQLLRSRHWAWRDFYAEEAYCASTCAPKPAASPPSR